MRVRKTPARCKAGHEFVAELIVDCPIPVAVAAMKAVRCPECGAKKVFIVTGKAGDEILAASGPAWSNEEKGAEVDLPNGKDAAHDAGTSG